MVNLSLLGLKNSFTHQATAVLMMLCFYNYLYDNYSISNHQNPDDQPEFPVVTRKYFIHFLFPQVSSSITFVFLNREEIMSRALK